MPEAEAAVSLPEGETGIPALDATNRLSDRLQAAMLGAETDVLTECKNRSALDKIINTFQPRSDLAIVFIDLASFKSINDTYGHNVGDTVLKQLALKLKELFRVAAEEDLLFRYGGDEFVLICTLHPNKQPTTLDDLVAHIQQRLESISIQITLADGCTTSPTTADYGIVTHQHANKQAQFDLSDLIRQADAKMYIYKNTRKARANEENGLAPTQQPTTS